MIPSSNVNVTCTAPFTAILVDTNKGVRPCCVYEGYIGNLKENSVSEIVNGEKWQEIKTQMRNNEWPKPCLSCREREILSNGWSVRRLFNNGTFDVTGWEEEKLTYLEFNGSNICNLACLHCSPGFSSRWVADMKKATQALGTMDLAKQEIVKDVDAVLYHNNDIQSRSTRMHLPDDELVLRNLRMMDLTNLTTLNLKGGEPFLNSETLVILNYLNEMSLLKNVSVIFSTNGTHINEEILEVLANAKGASVNISIDGTGDLFNYVRYGDGKFDSIESFIARLNKMENVWMRASCSVMNYNVFSLLEIRDWVESMSLQYKRIAKKPTFVNCVQSPAYLSIRTLRDETRDHLIDHYQRNNDDVGMFDIVISTLRHERLGQDLVKKWVYYTELMEKTRGNSIVKIVPALEAELASVE